MSACSEIVGHSVKRTPKGHVPMAEEKWLVQRTWISSYKQCEHDVTHANMHKQDATTLKRQVKRKMTFDLAAI